MITAKATACLRVMDPEDAYFVPLIVGSHVHPLPIFIPSVKNKHGHMRVDFAHCARMPCGILAHAGEFLLNQEFANITRIASSVMHIC